MFYQVFDKFFTTYPNKSIRLLEIIPPLITIFTITLPLWAAFYFPVQLAYFVIFFDMYWLYKSINLVVCTVIAMKRIRRAEAINWLARAERLTDFNKMHHIAIVPTYTEPINKIAATIDSIKNQTFPVRRIHVFLALEEREKDVKEKAEELKKMYEGVFGSFHYSLHPDLPGEVKGKSSNQAFAIKEADKLLVQSGKLDPDVLTVSSVDADSVFDKQYFAYLTHSFLTSKDRYFRFWQSATPYYNNFWRVPSVTRIMSFFGSLHRTALLVQHLKLIPHSTYSLSFKLHKNIDFWDTDVIPEDYRVFFKAFFRTGGRVEVEPIYLLTTMDAAESHTYIKSIKNRYHQERRWAWGVADDAVYMRWWLTVKDMPFLKKTFLVGTVLLEHLMWPTYWFIITVFANLIAFLNPVFFGTNLGYELPQLSRFILSSCLVSLFIMMFLDNRLRQYTPAKIPLKRQLLFPFEFFLMPITGFFLSAFPALISHTQLFLGKRLEYKVTEKV